MQINADGSRVPSGEAKAGIPARHSPAGRTHHALFSHVKERRFERQAEARQDVRTVKIQPHFFATAPNGGRKNFLA
jgi:hypothetical protein